jgi:DNA-directed RNA polymerase II subunit RPB1
MKRIQTNEHENPSKIIGIQFSMLSPEEIRKNSVVEVISRDSIGGLFDPKMGVLEKGLFCPTDGLTYMDTPGYFGHMEMAMPVFFVQHIKDIVKICKVVCYKCSKLLMNKNRYKHLLKLSPEERWQVLGNIHVRRCGEDTEDGCGCKQPTKIKLEGFSTIQAIWEKIHIEGSSEPTTVTQTLSAERVYKMFKRISDEDVQFMGFSPVWSRPEWMICYALPIAPPAVRPSVKHDAQQRSEDDLTHIYMNILKYNNMIKEAIATDTNTKFIEKNYQLLQYFVTMIANNKATGTSPIGQNSGRTFQCISSRLNTKNGRIRGNLMGKRVDFSARSVITGDPNLSITQLGVPMKIAKNITKPVTVNERNRNFLMKLIQNGPDVHPGANRLERNNGDKVSLRYVDRDSIVLEPGDKVHRHMMDGDYVLFNRQPSLHKMSMMCHDVKVMSKGDTFRFNVGVTNPYNADFDGDEMNMHMPQSMCAETELMILPAVTHQIVSPSKNAPIIGIFQDSLLGCFRFTRNTVKMNALDAMNLLMMSTNVNVSQLQDKKGKQHTSFDILSHILPPITVQQNTKLYDVNKERNDPENANQVIRIKNGKYIGGQLEKSIIASASKGIIHRITNDYNNPTCVQFIDNLQNIITEYMRTSSFSVGISDLIANKKTKQEILQVVSKQKQDVQQLIQELHIGIYENNSAYSNAVDFETRVNNILNKATEQAGKIGRNSLNKSNRFLMIVNSGSKGSPINISQMLSCLGQQSVEGKRVPYGFEHRTLPHFNKYDDSPTARGFIENSFISGLSPHEMFFHAMAGRIGLIDTAVKTSETGYIQRRIVKSLEDIYITYDQTVRNHMGKIVQFAYGDDGFDSIKVENQPLPLVEMSIEDIYTHYDMVGLQEADSNKHELLNVFSKPTVTRMTKQRVRAREKTRDVIERMIQAREDIVDKVFQYKNENMIRLPIHIAQLIKGIHGQMEIDETFSVDVTPLEAFELIEENWQRMMDYSSYTQKNPLLHIMYEFFMNPKELLIKRRFNKKALHVLLDTIFLKYKQSIVHPGEMVGVIAAQSVGEPTTQLTLNTFHNVGVASKSNVTRGVPRIEEILRLTKNPKNPSVTITLKPADAYDQDNAMNRANMIEHIRLCDVVKYVQIYFDPYDDRTVIEEDRSMLEEYYIHEQIVKEFTESTYEDETVKSKWVIRLEMDADIMLDKNIRMDDIYFAINEGNYGQSNISCIYSDYNDSKLIFRIRLDKPNKKEAANQLDSSDEIYVLKSFQESLLKKTILRGIQGISKVLPRKVPNNVIKEDGKYVRKDKWVLDTTGTNLIEILGLNYIDVPNTYSNDIQEIYHTLGIEAARQAILIEFTEVMEHSDVYLNYHHLSILCDRMTYNGKDMVAVYRSGILKDNIGPVAKATFEMHTEKILEAARHGHLDNMRGVSANVMTGQFGYFGTGAFNILLDLQHAENMNENPEEVVYVEHGKQVEKSIQKTKHERKNMSCDKDTIQIDNHLSEDSLKNPTSSQTEDASCVLDDDYDMGF